MYTKYIYDRYATKVLNAYADALISELQTFISSQLICGSSIDDKGSAFHIYVVGILVLSERFFRSSAALAFSSSML